MVAVALFCRASVSAAAQEAPAYTRFLLPIYTTTTPGAYGSLWQARTFIHYSGSEEASVVPRAFCYGVLCPTRGNVEPGLPAVPFQRLAGFPESAILVHVEAAYASSVTFNTRIRDLSRAADSGGTEVPAIREDEMSARAIYLLNVPVETRFRDMLRIYALPDVEAPEVDVRYYRQPDPDGSSLDLNVHRLRTERVTLRRRVSDDSLNLYPALAEIGNVELLPELRGEKAVWIEIVPVTAGLRLWALVSITNNETQQVTVVTPQRQ